MNLKSTLYTSFGVFVSFLVIMVAVYFLMPYINPEKGKSAENNNFQQTFTPIERNISAVDSLQNMTDSLRQVIETYRKEETEYQGIIDSLNSRLASSEEQNDTLKARIPRVAAENIEEVSKSLLTLDEDQLTPIVNILKDDQLISLYNSASRMQRSKLLRSLEPEKAANILKQIM
ncbi:hypothetical protein [Fodinibius sediminis]|uniref:Flagellar motility protein MotE, a chaperone for MotC folding n=1 Tax=Fodinibius sediminis TaxID=1214077 RepID=A0A521CJ27_9BACT|nr:hypothetical protein [Fodinibius sediminis]SMO59385.1 hypothetical protein SAMN06265218_106110 [Fodinibius sediminis]